MRILEKIWLKICAIPYNGFCGKIYNYISPKMYMSSYVKYLKRCGIKIDGMPNYISSDVYFDGHDYSLITVGDGTVISMEVILLTHDYSIARGIESVKGKTWSTENTPYFLKPINIGRNCFIGIRSIIMPGTIIGDNCIIGAYSVVKGNIPDNSVVIGNPGKVIMKTDEWAEKHMKIHDYLPRYDKE